MESANAGLCIEPENADDLLKAIIRLKEDKDLRVSLGLNGSDYVNSNASRSQTARAYLEILLQLLTEGD